MRTPATNETTPSQRRAVRLAALALAAAVLATGPSAASAQDVAPEICPPSDQAACLVRCKLHKRKCHRACTARKKQCLHKVRAEVQACKLGCNADASTDESAGACKRRCVAEGIETARKQCKLGKPVCMRRCNPESCREMCDIGGEDGAGDGTAAIEAAGALDTEPTEVEPIAPDQCVPPVDRECLGECAGKLRECARRVHAAGRECIAGCGDMRGEERWRCYRECAETAHEQGKRCKVSFRDCASECHDAP